MARPASAPGRELKRDITASATAIGAGILGRRNLRSIILDTNGSFFIPQSKSAGPLTSIFKRWDVSQLSKGNVSRRSSRPGAGHGRDPNTGARGRIVRVLVYALRDLSRTLATRLKENAALLAAVRWGRSQAARHGGQAPFLDIAFNKDEPHLTKVDMDRTRAVGPDGREEVLGAIVVGHILQLLAVAGEEDGPGPGSVANANHIAL